MVGLMALLGTGVASAGLGLISASSASAAPTSGSVEICKASVPGSLAVVGPFTFAISGVAGLVTVNAGQCSVPIAVAGTTATITETSNPAITVTAITAPAGATYLHTVTPANLAAGVATVDLLNNVTSTVTFTNAIDPGFVEVCKFVTAGSNISGPFSFNITGFEGWQNGALASAALGPISVPAGQCSNPIPMPSGSVTVTEVGTNTNVTSIEAHEITSPTVSAITSSSLVAATATVNVAASTNPSVQETIVNFNNDSIIFKVCKAWGSGVEPGGASTLFPFTITASAPELSGAAGANVAPAPVSIIAGTCSPVPMTFRAGTTVTVTEGIVPGTKVTAINDIALDGAETMLTGPGGTVETSPSIPQLANRNITFVLGTAVNSGQPNPGNEVDANFTDSAADPGQLKICKFAGTPAPVGTSFSFNYSGTAYTSIVAGPGGVGAVGVGPIVPVSGTVVVTVGSCTLIGGIANGAATPFLFNSNVTVTEAPSTGNSVSAIGTDASLVSTNVATARGTLTTEPVLSGVNLTTGVSTVTLGEDTLTVLNYTDIDPPLVSTGGSGGGTSSGGGSSSGGSSSGGSSSGGSSSGGGSAPVASGGSSVGSSSASTASSTTPVVPTSVVSSTPGTIVAPVSPIAVTVPVVATTSGSTVTPVITVKLLTPKQKAAELKAFDKTLAKVKSAIVNENKLIAKAHGAARAADVRRLHALQLEQKLLNKEIRSLK